jgi:hypothetical protein
MVKEESNRKQFFLLPWTDSGEMAEWSIASDLKSEELTGSVSSNLTLSC